MGLDVRDPDGLAAALADGFARTRIDPRCSDCGGPAVPRGSLGPFLCDGCASAGRAEASAVLSEMRRERRRSVHVVRLPEGMTR